MLTVALPFALIIQSQVSAPDAALFLRRFLTTTTLPAAAPIVAAAAASAISIAELIPLVLDLTYGFSFLIVSSGT